MTYFIVKVSWQHCDDVNWSRLFIVIIQQLNWDKDKSEWENNISYPCWMSQSKSMRRLNQDGKKEMKEKQESYPLTGTLSYAPELEIKSSIDIQHSSNHSLLHHKAIPSITHLPLIYSNNLTWIHPAPLSSVLCTPPPLHF